MMEAAYKYLSSGSKDFLLTYVGFELTRAGQQSVNLFENLNTRVEFTR